MNREPELRFNSRMWDMMAYEFVFIDRSSGKRMVAEPLTLKEVPPSKMIEQPTFYLKEDAMIQLMNDLWIAGIRPSERIIEPMNREYMNNEINWLRETADHLMKKPK